MSALPEHGRSDCALCFGAGERPRFGRSMVGEASWRLTHSPLAWGNTTPEVVVLGFSKGPTQAGAMDNVAHNEIPYKGGRLAVGKILAHVGLLPKLPDEALKAEVAKAISDQSGRFHFGSMIRCTVERNDPRKGWTGTGGNMLDEFVATPFGKRIASNCVNRHMANLPEKTKLVVLFGMGKEFNYVNECFKLFKNVRGGHWTRPTPISYTDGTITVVHVEHFKSMGNLLPWWLGEKPHPRGKLGQLAKECVQRALAK